MWDVTQAAPCWQPTEVGVNCASNLLYDGIHLGWPLVGGSLKMLQHWEHSGSIVEKVEESNRGKVGLWDSEAKFTLSEVN